MSAPKVTRWDAPEVSVRTTRSMLLYFERTYGRARLEQAWTQMPLSLEYLDDLKNFISYAFLERFLSQLTEASGDPDFVDKAGRHIATPEGLGFAYYLLRSVGSPELAYRKTIELGATYNRVGHFTVEKSSPNELTLSYRSDVRENHRLACRGRMANFCSFPTIWGLPEAKVEELQCQVQGADSCRYHLSWQRRPPIDWRRWVGLGLGAAVGGLSFGATPWAAGIALGAFFGGAWLDARRFARNREELLRDNTAIMSRSAEELQKRADEVFKANVELDKRVAERTADLEEALGRLRKVDQLKSEFFANVSHELRTPLTLILAPVEEQLASTRDPVTRAMLSGVRGNSERLLRLIDDLLDLSRLEAGALTLTVGPVDLGGLAKSVGALMAQTAQARGIDLEVRVPPATPGLEGDLHRLEIVVTNLLGNALKFTPRGGKVTLEVKELPEGAELCVRDTGPGIPPNEVERIFERFYQVVGEASGQGAKGGVGIGLALAKQLAELHGGTLRAESAPGAGATFTLSLPKGRAHFKARILERAKTEGPAPQPQHLALSEPEPVAPSVSSSSVTVLVVEDHQELRALLKRLLAPIARVLEAADGDAGWALAQESRPDLIVSDVMMPGLSGAQLCAKVKGDPKLGSTPVILLTARSGPEAALEGFAAGADEFIEKPFHPQVLLARVQAQLRLRALASQLASQAGLAAVGSLAAGVGHEVRNPLNAVLNGVRVLRAKPGLDARDTVLLDAIADGAARIEKISSALVRHVSPAEAGGARPVDVQEGISSALRLMDFRLGQVTVHQEVGETKVVAPASELNQVFINLLDNSLKAGARNLWLRAEQQQERVRLVFEDDGTGVPAEVAPRIFDPFFTTRAPGEGTGLGLYLCRQSLQRWGGAITHRDRPGGGSVFTVDLPAEGR